MAELRTDIDGTDPRAYVKVTTCSEARANYLGSRRLRNRSIHVRLSLSRSAAVSHPRTTLARVYIVSIPLTFGFPSEVAVVAATKTTSTRELGGGGGEEDDGGIGGASSTTSTECRVVGFQTSVESKERRGERERERESDYGGCEGAACVLVEQRVPFQRQMAPKGRASER